MKKSIKVTGLIMIAAIVLLAIFNPTMKDFKEYLGTTSDKREWLVYRRTSNWVIFSTYTTNLPQHDIEYIGFFGNFFPNY